jgi:hypothetical protein
VTLASRQPVESKRVYDISALTRSAVEMKIVVSDEHITLKLEFSRHVKLNHATDPSPVTRANNTILCI